MIEVPKERIKQVEYLIRQSLQGHHALFDAETVKRVFQSPFQDPISNEDAYEVEPHLERVIDLPTLAQKRAYLERLDKKILDRVVRTYFQLIESSMPNVPQARH